MSNKIAQRTSVRDSFIRIVEELDREFEKGERTDSMQLKMLWRRAEDRFLSLEKFDNEIWDDLVQDDVPQAVMNEEFNDVQEFRDKWSDINCRMDVIFSSKSSAVRSIVEPKSYKLPKLKLVEFDGNPRYWLSFWSQFEAIHEDDSLSDEVKFQYLIQATAVESKARKVVTSFPPTQENYPKAIDHLKSRFGKDKVLVEVYVRDLLKLVLSNTNGQQAIELSTLYDQLETQLRSLESLGVTTDKYEAMLYPLVESALSEDVLRTWERTRNQQREYGDENQLKKLMEFLRSEVESDIRLKMAKRGVIENNEKYLEPAEKRRKLTCEHVTVTDLLNKDRTPSCIFCGKYHHSNDCLAAKKMSLDQRRQKVYDTRSCFKCLKENHIAKACRAKVICNRCNGNHYRVMCSRVNDEQKSVTEINGVSTYVFGFVYLQTLLIHLEHQNKSNVVRALIDTGSERSYIRKGVAQKIGFERQGQIEIAHSLFGGHVTRLKRHSVYKVDVTKKDGTAKRRLEFLDVDTICGEIAAPSETCIQELEEFGIFLSDNDGTRNEVDVLIGADIASTLYTGRMYQTSEGPVAYETSLGWTLMGKTNLVRKFNNQVLLSHSLHVSNAKISDLWRLDVIGINDPVENQSRDELAESALQHFKEKVKKLPDGRYEVELPWIEGHQRVSNNLELARKRLKPRWKSYKDWKR